MITKELDETINKLTNNDKEIIFQKLWEDLNKENNNPIPEEHQKILIERYKSYKNGSANISEWKDVKKRIISYEL